MNPPALRTISVLFLVLLFSIAAFACPHPRVLEAMRAAGVEPPQHVMLPSYESELDYDTTHVYDALHLDMLYVMDMTGNDFEGEVAMQIVIEADNTTGFTYN
ncbi:hypothetical protein GF324_09200, partial [bacterium]|nr:hypothetical protein [bacterium]